MSYTLPKYTKALTLQESTVPRKPTYHDVVLSKRPIAPPKPGEVAVKLGAVGFNHKDVAIEEHHTEYHLLKSFVNRYGFVRGNTLESP
jgi:NADPH:quinone reductase-like Zn-dependent oxidoreductase